ncbi:MAG: efflux RND transporter periplasmic adaptor subunit [Bryobacterales bacterium]|nr:efflux RND transporter periplasmic adaptor subunit [Acidobacteriota bacterium]MCB9383143.1 efflux RND transporter periplasmic adaptor subunit [Bryobacterales bacterium]
MRAKVYVFLLTVAVLCGAGWWASQHYDLSAFPPKARAETKDAAKKDEKKEDEPTPIEVETAVNGAIASRIRSTANLRALRDVALQSQTQGVVTGIAVEEGDAVQAGQLLCKLDDRELKINLELARQRLEQTKVQLESAKIIQAKNQTQIEAKKAELDRNEKALAEGLVSDTDVALLRNQLAELKHDERAQAASVEENQYRVRELESEIDRNEVLVANTRITAPFAGRITERTVQLGQTVGASDNLFRLATFSPLFADVFLSEPDSRRVRPGQQVEVRLDSGETEKVVGKVARVSPVVDDSTGTVKVTAELRTTDASYRPGAFVRVAIETDVRNETVLIPKRAIVEQDGESFVFVSDGETAKRRSVELGYEDGDAVEVRSGVKAGEKVIVAGQGSLKDGGKTRLVTS